MDPTSKGISGWFARDPDELRRQIYAPDSEAEVSQECGDPPGPAPRIQYPSIRFHHLGEQAEEGL